MENFTRFHNEIYIYDNKFYNKLYEINLENFCSIISVIQLDNQDLILFSESVLKIYRLINGKFVIVQKIEDNKDGYPMQMEIEGCIPYPKSYKAEFIKEISGNRFILVSNYGYKIYSLNEKMNIILLYLKNIMKV